jgi:hypothetical protein
MRRRLSATALALVIVAGAVALIPGSPANATDAGRPAFDRNGDGRSDFAVLRETSETAITWYWHNGTSFNEDVFGNPGADLPVVGDFDGDGINDPAVARFGAEETTSPIRWIVLLSGGGVLDVEFGETSDVPLTGDIDGDGRTDLVVWRPGSPSTWFVLSTTGGFGEVDFGDSGANADTPALGDVDGDGRTDIIIRRIGDDDTTTFHIRTTTGGYPTPIHFGHKNDAYVSGDFNGDGIADIAVVREGDDGNYEWFVTFSNGTFLQFAFGSGDQNDVLVQNDYDGNGFTDIAVWRPGTPGTLFVFPMPFGVVTETAFGEAGDLPLNFWFNCFQNLPTLCD